jgi:hypothetical protein
LPPDAVLLDQFLAYLERRREEAPRSSRAATARLLLSMSRATPARHSRRQRNRPSRRVELTFVPGWHPISAAGRRVSLRFVEGYRFAQVYAPPKSGFICFEPMTAPVNPFESERTRWAEPGSAQRARFEIVVRTSGLE